MDTVERLPYDGSTIDEVYQYFKTRHLQLMQYGFHWDHALVEKPGGYVTTFTDVYTATKYDSFYVTADQRNRGHAVKMVREAEHTLITVDDCHVAEFCLRCGRLPRIVQGTFDTPEYKLIEQFYGDKRANRSGVFLMNHIDEGLWVMQQLGASERAKLAFCLHPLIQTDADLKDNLEMITQACSPYVVALALEYRSQANRWLSDAVERDPAGTLTLRGLPTSGPLPDVFDMLVADKVQNYKDFILYHKETHARSEELDVYFKTWLRELKVLEYEYWINHLITLSPKEQS